MLIIIWKDNDVIHLIKRLVIYLVEIFIIFSDILVENNKFSTFEYYAEKISC